jgi:hypothetical protein
MTAPLTRQELERLAKPSSFHRSLDALEVIADWKEDLLRRIRRRQLIYELVTVAGEQDRLIDEVQTIKRVCKCFGWGST